MQNPEEEEWEAFKKEIAVEVAVSQDLQVHQVLQWCPPETGCGIEEQQLLRNCPEINTSILTTSGLDPHSVLMRIQI
jgi:hypothetical protein